MDIENKDTPEDIANDLIHWVKNEISCLYMVSEMKKELKPLSKERYDYWDNIHKLLLKKFLNK